MAITINGTTGIAGVDGSAGTPAVQGADTNTGIFFPAADTIAFAEGGIEVMRINSSGDVGIGTTSPTAELDVVRSLNGSTVEILVANTFYAASSTDEAVAFQGEFYQNDVAARRGAGYIQFTKAGDFSNNANASANMIFGTRNAGTLAERARIDSSGNLLVNTTTAQTGAKLAVTGGIQGIITSGTAVVNPTSPASSSIDFTGIPSWVKRITVMFSGLSLSSTADILVQLGDAGGIEATGYISSGSATGTGAAISNSTVGMIIRSAAAASITSGIMTLQNITGNSWVASFAGKQSSTSSSYGGGDKTLSDTLTQIRITTTSTDTFDAGTVNIYYEG